MAPSDSNELADLLFSTIPPIEQKTVSDAPPLAVKLIGAGGCGINLLRRIMSRFKSTVTCLRIDTCERNIRGSDEACLVVGNGGGSGQVRDHQAAEIEADLVRHVPAIASGVDVAVVIFSLSGGSGSVIGPRLISLLAERNVAVLAVVVSDATTPSFAHNFVETFQSLHTACKEGGFFLPMMLFHNRVHPPNDVDSGLPERVRYLLHMLTMRTYELDRQDRLNFLYGQQAHGRLTGIYQLHVVTGTGTPPTMPDDQGALRWGEVWTGDRGIVNAMMTIGVLDDPEDLPWRVQLQATPSISFSGIFTDVKLVPMAAIIVPAVPSVAILMKTAEQVRQQKEAADKKTGDLGGLFPQRGRLT